MIRIQRGPSLHLQDWLFLSTEQGKFGDCISLPLLPLYIWQLGNSSCCQFNLLKLRMKFSPF